MFSRIALALPIGAAVTAALLFTMHLMIDTGQNELVEPAQRVVDFVRVDRTETVQVKEERPTQPEELAPMPELTQAQSTAEFSNTIQVALAKPDVGFSSDINVGGFEATDGEYLPIVKVAAQYPMRALQRRIEGYVIVRFVVTTSGEVRDVEVVESTAEVFEEAAIEAALKFKYKPRVIDGQPIEVTGVRNKITFRLDA